MLEAFTVGFVSFSNSVFGNTLVQLALFLASIALFIVLGKLAFFFFQRHAQKIRETTKHRIESVVAGALEKPLWLILFTAGLAVGAQFLSLDTATHKTVNDLFGILLTIVITWLLIKLIDSIIKEYLLPLSATTGFRIDDNLMPIVSNTAKAVVVLIAITVILTIFGYNVTAILAGLGIGGLAVAFAAQQTIADVFGGVSLLTSKPFRVGDTIQVENITGTVTKVGIRTTRILGLDKSEITFSNAKLASSIIKNLSSGKEQRVEMNLGLVYNTPFPKVQLACDILKKIIHDHPGCVNNPIIYFSDFREYSLNIQVIYFIKHKDWMQVRHEINMKIKEEFDKNQIEFAFPTQTIHMPK